MQTSPIQRAIEAAGGLTAMARRLGVTKQAIVKWRHTRVPAERVLEIEAAASHQVSRYELRPDIYGEPPG
jgi:DNA-binding transcriptional regulator YdaS (Cro superfamily)